MSLLLDARKKIELALDESASTGASPIAGLSLEDLPPNAPQNPSDNPTQTRRTSLPPHSAVAAGKNLFAAKKAAPAYSRGRLGIIPIALISGSLIAAGGGYYVWREITPRPQAQRLSPPPSPPSAPIVIAAAPPAATPPAIAPTPAPAKQAAPAAKIESADATPGAKPAAHARAAVKPRAEQPRTAQPVQIERIQDSNGVDPILLAAYQAYRSGDYDTAWQRYSEMLRKDGKNRDALLGMAAVAQQQSQDAIAAQYYSQVLMLDPRDPSAYAGMSSLFGASDATGVESRLKQLLAQHPEAAALHFAQGNLYAKQSRWGEAQQAYFSAYSLEPGNAQYAFNLAISLDHLGKGKLAAQHYQRALQLDNTGNASFDHAQTQQRLDDLMAH